MQKQIKDRAIPGEDKLIGHKIKIIRSLAGMTQGRLAEVSGFAQKTISDMEVGRRRVSAVELLILCYHTQQDIEISLKEIMYLTTSIGED